MHVQGKCAIITGASSGFGKALAERLVSKGANVILADIDNVEGEKLAASLNEKVKRKCAVFQLCDVTKQKDLVQLFNKAEESFTAADIVINNAGISDMPGFYDSENPTWYKTLDIDLVAVIEGTRLGVRHFKKHSRSGVIVNTASLAGIIPLSLSPVYSAAKTGVVGFTRSLNVLRHQNIRVNAVAPSFSPTNIVTKGRANLEAFDKFVSKVKLVPVEQVVDAFMLLIEDDSHAGQVAQITPQHGITMLVGEKSPKTKKPSGKL
ncbi:15-hydroxyprostaglandin dehydrogenase, partial [Basidiobolus meristosporus CBS 931.73]